MPEVMDKWMAMTKAQRGAYYDSLDDKGKAELDAELTRDYWTDKPSGWVEERLNETLWEKQVEILESVKKNQKTAVASCHGIGKSFTAARAALWFLENHAMSIVVTTAPTFRQVQKVLWQEMRRAANRANPPLLGDMLLTEWKIEDGWYAFGFSTNDPDAFQGQHPPSGHILLIFDEAAGIEPPIWESSEGILTSEGARMLEIGNPTDPTSNFAREFKDRDVAKFHVSCFDTPNFTAFGITLEDIKSDNWREKMKADGQMQPVPYPYLITPEWVAGRARRWGVDSPMFIARCLGQFPLIDENAWIPIHLPEAALENEIETEPSDFIHAGLDVARFGSNETVLTVASGYNKILSIYRWRQKPTTETAERAMQICSEWGIQTISIDADGIGGAVVDMMKKYIDEGDIFKGWDLSVQPIHSGAPADDDEHYQNRRMEMWAKCKRALEERVLDFTAFRNTETGDDIIQQLSSPHFKYGNKNRIALESKEDMLKREIESPDIADSIIYCFFGGRQGRLMDFMESGGQRLSQPVLDDGERVFGYGGEADQFTSSGGWMAEAGGERESDQI